jgi:hypothetical protein
MIMACRFLDYFLTADITQTLSLSWRSQEGESVAQGATKSRASGEIRAADAH